MIFDDQHMRYALEHALLAQNLGEVPVGAIVVDRSTGEVVAASHNRVEGDANPMRHAEMIAIESACRILKCKNLSGYDLYVTLEPCTMCAAAISHARIDRLFYGAPDVKQGAVENGVRFFTHESCMHRPEVYNGILSDESSNMLKEFFENLRS